MDRRVRCRRGVGRASGRRRRCAAGSSWLRILFTTTSTGATPAAGRQGRGGPIGRFWVKPVHPPGATTLDYLHVGRFALGGGGVVAHACIGALVARASASCGGSCDQGDRLSLAGEPRVEICSVFRRRWASCRWIFQPVARAADACSRWVRWSRARHGPALGGAVARLTCACTGQDGRVLDVCLC